MQDTIVRWVPDQVLYFTTCGGKQGKASPANGHVGVAPACRGPPSEAHSGAGARNHLPEPKIAPLADRPARPLPTHFAADRPPPPNP